MSNCKLARTTSLAFLHTDLDELLHLDRFHVHHPRQLAFGYVNRLSPLLESPLSHSSVFVSDDLRSPLADHFRLQFPAIRIQIWETPKEAPSPSKT